MYVNCLKQCDHDWPHDQIDTSGYGLSSSATIDACASTTIVAINKHFIMWKHINIINKIMLLELTWKRILAKINLNQLFLHSLALFLL